MRNNSGHLMRVCVTYDKMEFLRIPWTSEESESSVILEENGVIH